MNTIALATRALLSCRQAVMATQSCSVLGFPMTAVVPLGIAYDDSIIMLLSDMAQHSKNLHVDHRVSLLLHDDQEQNWQAAHRLSVLGHMVGLDPAQYDMDRLRQAYYTLHPELSASESQPDFKFWQLKPLRFRLVAGFAKVQWLEHIDCAQFNLDPDDIARINQALCQRRTPTRLLCASRYGVQVLESGRVRFLSFRTEAHSVAGVITQLATGSYDDPATSPSKLMLF